MPNQQRTARFAQITSGGKLATIGQDHKLGATAELCVAGNFARHSRFDDIFLYDRERIGGKVYTTDGHGAVAELAHKTFNIPFDIAVAGNFGGNLKDDLLLYNRANGKVIFLSVTRQGALQRERRNVWSSSWDMIIPGVFDGQGYADLLFYNRQSGRREFYTTNGRRPISRISPQNHWYANWDIIVPGSFEGNTPITSLMFYDRGQGWVQFYGTNGAGWLRPQPMHQRPWRRTWDIIVPGNFGGDARTDLFCYDRESDEAEFWAFVNGTFRQVGSTMTMDRKWRHIISGNFSDGGKADLFFLG